MRGKVQYFEDLTTPTAEQWGGIVRIILDTCALIWWSLDPDKLSQPAKDACKQMETEKNGLVPSTSIIDSKSFLRLSNEMRASAK